MQLRFRTYGKRGIFRLFIGLGVPRRAVPRQCLFANFRHTYHVPRMSSRARASESRDLRTFSYFCGKIGAKILPLASLGQDDRCFCIGGVVRFYAQRKNRNVGGTPRLNRALRKFLRSLPLTGRGNGGVFYTKFQNTSRFWASCILILFSASPSTGFIDTLKSNAIIIKVDHKVFRRGRPKKADSFRYDRISAPTFSE